MKKAFLLSTILLLCFSTVWADSATIYCEISNINQQVNIKAHTFWNVGYDKSLRIPASYISGNDKQVVKDFLLGRNRVKVKLYFPKKENGRRLNATTTVHVIIDLNGREIVNTKHFGQLSQDFVYFDTDILCRPDMISISLDKKKEVKIKIAGKYLPKNNEETNPHPVKEQPFTRQYSVRSGAINDVKLAQDVASHGGDRHDKHKDKHKKDKHHSISGTYECHKYDAKGKNNWHYVEIKKKKGGMGYIWKNKANISWGLTPTSNPLVFKVAESCPYYKNYKTAQVVLDEKNKVSGIWGPNKDFYTFKKPDKHKK